MIPLCPPEEAQRPTALALGSFDGLHIGHRTVIRHAVESAAGVPTVVSFWPHPREVLFGESRLRLDLPEEKLSLLEPLGVQQLVLVPFTRDLAALSAEAFVRSILLDTLQARHIAVGANFRFGKNRAGDTTLLQTIAGDAGVSVDVVGIVEDDQGRMSSSRIRTALEGADLALVADLLGRPYRFQGSVVHGRGLGRQLGWPTANLEVDGRKCLPALGVYAAWAWVKGQATPMAAVMNLGPQPTVDPTAPSAVEVHLLDRTIQLDGQQLLVEPVQRLRGQQKFAGLQELSAQIARDAQTARDRLAQDGTARA
ncbi:bifunctional riboflavin kinase/FAD synthetase [Parasynechococcus sp.]|uniref:bifunctional riboflavin kinase/FAD synthetase n=1 Tax=Parasynechococcus sp. TaxID=3101203 RepID=UPI003704A0F9